MNSQTAQTMAAIHRWIDEHMPEILASGENWKVTLHGGKGGDVRHVVERFGELQPPRNAGTVRVANR